MLTRREQRERFLSDGTFGDHVIPDEMRQLLISYLSYRDQVLPRVVALLRTEERANLFCKEQGISVGVTTTRSTDHHQSTKPLVAAAGHIARKVAREYNLDSNVNPQLSCFWTEESRLAVTARNLDGAIPSLENPSVVWEIKEYWAKTRGGSKMSDAVYECMLVGMELRMFEEETDRRIRHAVLVDGSIQWGHRLSDLRRFIDILNQGLLDVLIVGSEVETEWESFLRHALDGTSN